MGRKLRNRGRALPLLGLYRLGLGETSNGLEGKRPGDTKPHLTQSLPSVEAGEQTDVPGADLVVTEARSFYRLRQTPPEGGRRAWREVAHRIGDPEAADSGNV